jgi:Tfp pilus assembly protein PilF
VLSLAGIVAVSVVVVRALQGGAAAVRALDQLRRTDPAAAVARLERHLDARPRDALAWTILGHAHEDLDQDDRALSAYQRALSLDPDLVQALTGMGILHRKRREYDEALRFYERAVALDPTYAEAYSSMAVVALKLEDDARALEYATKARALSPGDPVIAANLAVTYHYNGRHAARDSMARVAERLGYRNVDAMREIFSGERTVRDP